MGNIYYSGKGRGKAMSAQITIVGLGSGEIEALSVGAWHTLKNTKMVYVRTADHPAVQQFKAHEISYFSFDEYYLRYSQFADVYQAIVKQLMQLAKNSEEPVLYAVPGHPMVAESTVQQLLANCSAEGIHVHLIGSESFLDRAFISFGIDPIEGFQLLDATSLTRYAINPMTHTIIGQVYDEFIASDVKLLLLDLYPADYEIYVGHYLGVLNQERIVKIPIFELDHHQEYGNLSVIWIPKSKEGQAIQRNFHRLHEIVNLLRSPGGCPWDREQTHTSLRKHLIEECYEVLDAIEEDDPDHLREELGDLLLQVMLHAQIEQEAGMFDVYDVIANLNEKLIRRHPHVFSDTYVENTEDVMKNWNQIKQQEKEIQGKNLESQSILSGIPTHLPSLLKSWKLQKKAAAVGFDWAEVSQVIAKISEELQEVINEIHTGTEQSAQKQKEELGDLLFAVVNLARYLKIDPDEALSLTNRKFVERFSYIEQTLIEQGKSFDEVNLQYMDNLWNESKKMKKNVKN